MVYLDGLRMGELGVSTQELLWFVGDGSIGDLLQYRLDYHWTFELALTL